MAKVICEIMLNGQTVLASFTVAAGFEAAFVKVKPGIGKPYWCWPSLPTTNKVVAADFTNAPIASSNTQENRAAIDAIWNEGPEPAQVLTWDPPYPPPGQ